MKKMPFRLKIKFFLILFIQLILLIENSQSSLRKAEDYFLKGHRNKRYYLAISNNLMKDGFYFASVPLIKEVLFYHKRTLSKSFDDLLDRVIGKVGIRQFESLPFKVLMRSKTPFIRYILARKLFRMKLYKRSLSILNLDEISNNHPIKPFALMLRGSLLSIMGKYERSIKNFKKCVEKTTKELKRSLTKKERRQLLINKDTCLLGISRSYFGKKDYDSAGFLYLDIEKGSYIWPEVLFEEAWTSFYKRDYNRTLGKLVTYKAPVFSHIFNPEINVLEALTYLELCLWKDAKKSVDLFYRVYEKPLAKINVLLSTYGKNYKSYYSISKKRLDGKVGGGKIFNKMLLSIIKDPAFLEMYDSFYRGGAELDNIKKIKSKTFRSFLIGNIKETLILQRNLIGAYVRKNIELYSKLISKNLMDMSYIKLEVLSKLRKEILDSYNLNVKNRARGDIKYLKRNEKQYFWDFNGEFWADELGDYVFALKSECKS
jgi:hypothetical protein